AEMDGAVGTCRVHQLDPRERLGGVDLHVRVPTPCLAAPVVLRLVAADQPRFDDERLELGPALDAVDRGRLGEEVVDLLPLVAVEVALDPGAEVLRLADVEHVAPSSPEQVDARSMRQVVGEADLPEVRAPAGTDGL